MSTDVNKHTIRNVLPRILLGSSPDQDEFLARCDTIGSGSQLLCTHTSHRKYKQTQSNPQALTLHRATHLNCDDHGSRLRQHCQLALCVTQATRHKAHVLSIHAKLPNQFHEEWPLQLHPPDPVMDHHSCSHTLRKRHIPKRWGDHCELVPEAGHTVLCLTILL